MSENFIPLSAPNLKGKELEYVNDVNRKQLALTGREYVSEFEQKISEYVGSKGAISCKDGKSEINIALKACDVQKKDEVIVPVLTFVYSDNPANNIEAEPIFMDCDDSLNMDTKKLNQFCENECEFIDGKLINNQTKNHIKAIVVVHVFGNMADMKKIIEIADKYNMKVIEDATYALGTYYKDSKFKYKHAGTIGNIGIYSFNNNKIITTGGGGMIVSNDGELLKKIKYHINNDDVDYNYRITNLQAALGIAQLEKLENFIKIKRYNYNIYKAQINKIQGLRLLEFNDEIRSNYWFYSVYIEDEYKFSQDELIKHMYNSKIQVKPIGRLISEQNYFATNLAYKIEKAYEYRKRIINIPCSSNLSKDGVMRVVEAL